MVNAWSLAASVLDGTLDEDYPIMKKDEIKLTGADEGVVNVPTDINLDQDINIRTDIEHSDYWYDYTRNNPDAENPFTDAFDYMMAESVVSGDSGDSYYPSAFTTFSDNDDQIAHHICLNTEGQKKEIMEKREPKRNHQYKYHETEIMNDIEDYVSGTYNGHYTGREHEFRNVQTIDLMAARDIAPQFCQANILKYGSRYGSKDGRNKKDLLKVIHYAMLLLHFDGHYGKPSSSDGSFDRMP